MFNFKGILTRMFTFVTEIHILTTSERYVWRFDEKEIPGVYKYNGNRSHCLWRVRRIGRKPVKLKQKIEVFKPFDVTVK